MRRWNIIFWEPSVSPHKLALFRALAQSPRTGRCIYVAQEPFPEGRAGQGWELDDRHDLDIRVAPTDDDIADLIDTDRDDTIHLFSGIHWVPCIVAGLDRAIRSGARFGLMVEPRASEGWRGLARLAHSWLTERRIRTHAAFVLAIGRHGPSWFRRTGYRADRIFPFAYFLPHRPAAPAAPSADRLRLGYLGRLTQAKGISLVLDLPPHLTMPACLRIAGAGDAADAVRALAGSRSDVAFDGAVPMSEVPAFLAAIDILLVPSLTTDDGWAAVVSEALMAGCAVVASERAGASILLDDPARGRVLTTFDSAALAEAVAAVVTATRFDAAAREARARWAARHLTGEAGAAMLFAILDHVVDAGPRPSPFYAETPD